MRAMAATGAVAILAQRAGQAAVNGLSHASPRLALTAAALAGYLGLPVPSDAMSLAEAGTAIGSFLLFGSLLSLGLDASVRSQGNGTESAKFIRQLLLA